MKDYSILSPFHGLSLLNEANLNRIMCNAENNGIIIISANRDGIHSKKTNCDLSGDYAQWLTHWGYKGNDAMYTKYLAERNMKAYRQLYDEIKKSPYSYSQVYGGFKGSNNIITTYQPSFIVYCVDRLGKQLIFDDLFEFGKKLCGRYNQEAFYAQAPNAAPNYYDENGHQVNDHFSKFVNFYRDGEEYFTTAKRPKGNNAQQITSDIVFENTDNGACKLFIFEHYAKEMGIEYLNRIKRIQSGEILML